MTRGHQIVGILVAAHVLAACGSEAPDEPAADNWGPLAVINDVSRAGADQDLGFGEIRIDDDCVVLVRDDDSEETLVWRRTDARWQAEQRTIAIRQPDATVELASGDTVRIAGLNEIGPAIEWTRQPAPSCPTDLILVHQVARSP